MDDSPSWAVIVKPGQTSVAGSNQAVNILRSLLSGQIEEQCHNRSAVSNICGDWSAIHHALHQEFTNQAAGVAFGYLSSTSLGRTFTHEDPTQPYLRMPRACPDKCCLMGWFLQRARWTGLFQLSPGSATEGYGSLVRRAVRPIVIRCYKGNPFFSKEMINLNQSVWFLYLLPVESSLNLFQEFLYQAVRMRGLWLLLETLVMRRIVGSMEVWFRNPLAGATNVHICRGVEYVIGRSTMRNFVNDICQRSCSLFCSCLIYTFLCRKNVAESLKIWVQLQ